MKCKGPVIFTALVGAAFVLSMPVPSQAIQIGPRIACCKHGLDVGGWKPLEKPVADKPLDGAKMAAGDVQRAVGKAGTDTWQAVKRPFVETWKFLSDPTAGLRRTAQNYISQAEDWLTALVKKLAVWLSIGFGAALALAVCLAMGFAALIVRFAPRHRSRPTYRFSVKDGKDVPLLDVEFADEAEGRKAQAAIEGAMKHALHVEVHQAQA